jgi:murein DD-endopeptidase MepM/ murein hydrolase activator NlpD
MHEGLDIAARTGTPIFASADGIVSRAETAPGYGKLIVIDHGYGFKTYYGHNSKLFVKVGQLIKRGDLIAEVGSTGSSTCSHVHYEVRRHGVPHNPPNFLKATLSPPPPPTGSGAAGVFDWPRNGSDRDFLPCNNLPGCGKISTFAGGRLVVPRL